MMMTNEGGMFINPDSDDLHSGWKTGVELELVFSFILDVYDYLVRSTIGGARKVQLFS
jgi:hypothetical protein